MSYQAVIFTMTKVRKLLISFRILVVFGLSGYSSVDAADSHISIAGNADGICKVSGLHSETADKAAISRNVIPLNLHPNYSFHGPTSRSYDFRLREVLCNGGPNKLLVKSLKGGLVRTQRGTEMNVAFEAADPKPYKLKVRLGSHRFSELHSFSAGSVAHLSIMQGLSGPLIFDMDVENVDASAVGEVYYDILQIEIGYNL